MIYNYGYQDGMGEFYVIVDGDRCTGCEQCVDACLSGVLEMWSDDYDSYVVRVSDRERRRIAYTCGACAPDPRSVPRPCHVACISEAISHSW